jgi:hypothetical protein
MKESTRSYSVIFFLFLVSVLFLSNLSSPALVVQNVESNPVDEEMQIKKAVEDLYIKGLASRDFSLIKKVCIPETLLMSSDLEGKLHITTLERWSKRFDPQNPPFQKLDSCIVKIDRAGSAAQVKISFLVDSKQHVIDFLHMLKLDGKWHIVHIIDYRF